MAGLTAASLLAAAGRRVCVLEAHDAPGGYAHSFRMGDFRFCAQVHYIWGCGPGERIDRFLKKIGEHETIEFTRLDPDGYDHVVLPDGSRVRIPCGLERLAERIDERFPGQYGPAREFGRILERLREELGRLPRTIRWWQPLTRGHEFLALLHYRNRTLGQVFDECGLGREARAVLIANSGNFMLPPSRLSILAYTALFGGYDRGAYYPKRHFGQMVEQLAASITRRPGCHIYYETEVTRLATRGRRIESVTTADGKDFRAPLILCNADPPGMARLIGLEKFPESQRRALEYEYSGSAVTVYLGLKGIDLREYGFGRHNTWHLEQWDLDQTWEEALTQDWSRPWVFMATPSLYSDEPGIAPAGGQILELATAASYDYFRGLRDTNRARYEKAKRHVRDRLIDIVSAHHLPELRSHIALKVTGTPTTNEEFCRAPRGHSYAQALTPANMGLGRLGSHTPFENLYWCSAASGYPGVNGTIGTGMELYTELTGDEV